MMEQIADHSELKMMKAKVKRLQSELKDARNELCFKCGLYVDAHRGSCNSCKYRHDGTWKKDIDN